MSEPLVTIVVSAGGASEHLLRTCLGALERHKGATENKTLVVAPSHQSKVAWKVANEMGVDCRHFVLNGLDNLSGSRVHAAVLDRAVHLVDTSYMLTMDADCFPAADDWLDALMAPMSAGASVTGILHPYVPPSSLDIDKATLEYRIRSQLCWDNTHVACQLVGVKMLTKRLKVRFSDGDDTGLAIPKKAREMGMKVEGLMPTGCAMVDQDWQELESNRENCLVFGDKVYHHGGGSREVQGRGGPLEAWNGVRKRVLEEGGAEFLLEKGALHRYGFEHEQDIADEMVRRIMRGMRIYLETHDRAFED